MQFGPRTVIGAFNLCFNKRNVYIQRSFSECTGYAIRKKQWFDLEKNFHYFTRSMKIRFLYSYRKFLHNPMKIK